MKLNAYEPGVVAQLDDLHTITVTSEWQKGNC